jgi:hypothetical protein
MEYTFVDVPPGVYTLTCSGVDLFNSSTHVVSNGDDTPDLAQTILTPPALEGNNITAVLTWDASPPIGMTTTDLDIHLQFQATGTSLIAGTDGSQVENNGNCHVFYQNMECGASTLDRDNVQGGQYGGETISLGDVYESIYTFYAHCYSCYAENKALEDSGLSVKLFSSLGQIKEIKLPNPSPDNYNTRPTTSHDGTYRGVGYFRLFCIDASVSPPAVHSAVRYYQGTPVKCDSCPCEDSPQIVIETPPPPPPPPALVPGDTLAMEIANAGNFVTFTFSATKGVRYQFDCWLITLRDSVMQMHRVDANGNAGTRVALNDDRSYSRSIPRAQRRGSMFQYRHSTYNSQSTDYIITVSGYAGRYAGTFELRVTTI